jgi:SRSO17 transposase
MSKRNRQVAHRSLRRAPASGRRPRGRLTNQDVATGAAELLVFYQQFQDLFQRREQREWWRLYLCGQLSNLERKTIEPMILALLGPDPNAIRGMQHFVGQGEWAWAPFLERAQRLVAEWLGEPDAVIIADGSGFPKQGNHSVGVAPQYCGHVGKVANSQEGAFVLYASRRGHAFVDVRLYMPERWFAPEYQQRWPVCGIPETLTFHTEPELSLAMITDLVQRGELPFRWVTCDERYGEIPAFLDGIAALDKWYFAEMAVDTQVWLQRPAVEPPGPGVLGRPRLHPRVSRTAPRPQTLREVMEGLPARAWHVHLIKEGSKGPMVAEFAWLRVTPIRDKLPGSRCWAIFRRTLGPEPELKFFLSNAPMNCPPLEFVRVSGLRWPIETALEEAKGEVGMDHYETRTWAGWHHQMTLSILSHLCLVRAQLVFKKKSGVDDRTSTPTASPSDRRRPHQLSQYSGAAGVSPAPKLRRLLFAPQAHSCKAQAAIIQAPKTLIGAAQAEIS